MKQDMGDGRAAAPSEPNPQAVSGKADIPIARGRQRASKRWSEYPLGTKAWALMGGHWLRIEAGWKWMPNGGTFPTPGADAFDVTLPDGSQP